MTLRFKPNQSLSLPFIDEISSVTDYRYFVYSSKLFYCSYTTTNQSTPKLEKTVTLLVMTCIKCILSTHYGLTSKEERHRIHMNHKTKFSL